MHLIKKNTMLSIFFLERGEYEEDLQVNDFEK
jgi:hypothetical protein